MAVIIRSSLSFSSYPCSYSYPSVLSPLILPTSRNHSHDNYQRGSCFPLLSSGRSSSKRAEGMGIIHGYPHHSYHVTQALKRARTEDDNYDEEEGNYKREEQRWLREEQRWVREEQRWLREEARWNADRDSLLSQVSHLTHRIQELELELETLRSRVGSTSTIPETLSKIASLLQVLNTNTTSISPNQNQIPEYSGEACKPLVLEHAKSKSESDSQSEIHDPVPPPAAATTPATAHTHTPTPNLESKNKAKSSKLSLRMGSEGEEVRALQEALLNLGFYSGEEDMEFSSFSSGTQRAVKTWQASIGAPEDGIVTAELLERLYAVQQTNISGSSVNAVQDLMIPKQVHMDEANGTPATSVTEVREVQQTVVKKGTTDVEMPQHRVYLLGENRWEEPSRLKKGNEKQVNGATSQVSATKCLACRGEGRVLCMECDGTGEPNVEEQFLEWVEEGAKCPYCEGHGYTVCDVCEGKAVP